MTCDNKVSGFILDSLQTEFIAFCDANIIILDNVNYDK